MNAQNLRPILRRTRPGPVHISAAQKRLWILQQFDPRDPSWNRPLAIRLTGRLNLKGLEWSLSEIVRRHEILRSVFPEIGGEPVQIVGPAEPFHLEIRNLDYLPGVGRQKAVEQIATEESQTTFDLAKGPLVRAVLLRLDKEEHLLLLLMHHIVFDEWSEGILLRELAVLYETFGGGKMASPLPELPIQYADFSVWQRERLTEAALESQVDYWRQQLQGLTALMLPTDCPRSNTLSHQGARQSFILPLSLVEELKEISRRKHVTLFMTLLTALQILLSRYTGQEDIAVGVPVAGRTQLETESLIGCFINLVVLRVTLPGTINFQEALSRVRDSAIEAFEHQDVPFQKLVKELRSEGSANLSPLFQVMCELRNLPKVPIQQSGKLRMEIAPFSPDFIGALDLVLEVQEKPGSLTCTCRYAPALFRPDTIKRLTDHFIAVLQRLVDNPDQRLCELSLNAQTDRFRPNSEWYKTKGENLTNTCSPQHFEAQGAPTANATTEVVEDQQRPNVWSKTELEGKLVQIWRDVLGLDKVGVNDNFFEVGGHSLLMIKIHNKIGQLLGKKILASYLQRYPTIRSLADYLTKDSHE